MSKYSPLAENRHLYVQHSWLPLQRLRTPSCMSSMCVEKGDDVEKREDAVFGYDRNSSFEAGGHATD
jgi:hypothetical protein